MGSQRRVWKWKQKKRRKKSTARKQLFSQNRWGCFFFFFLRKKEKWQKRTAQTSNAAMIDVYPQRPSRIYCSGHALVQKWTMQLLRAKRAPSVSDWLLGQVEVLTILRRSLRQQNQGYHKVNDLGKTECRGGMWLVVLPWITLKRRNSTIASQNNFWSF